MPSCHGIYFFSSIYDDFDYLCYFFVFEWDYFFNILIFSSNFQSPDLYKMYTEELKDSRISYGDGGELLWMLLDFSTRTSALYEQYKVKIYALYVFNIYLLGDVGKC